MTATMPEFALFQQDAVAWLQGLNDASVDLIITDPAYESLEKHRARGTTTRLSHSLKSSNDWFDIFPNSRFPALLAELYRVLKKDRHFYMFCDQETMFVVKPMAEAAGFTFWKPLVWDKQQMGMGYHYRSQVEFILFFEKGKRKLNSLGVRDIISCPRVRGQFPTQKPVEVAEVLVKQSTQLDEVVIDPFMGSGFAGRAALRHGRHFMGSDTSESAVELARANLQGELTLRAVG